MSDEPALNFEKGEPKRSTFWRQTTLIALSIVVLFCGVAMLSDGVFGVEKTLTGFCLPVGLAWLALTTVTITSWLRTWNRQSRLGLSLLWLLVSAITTSPVPDFCFRLIEKPLENEFKPGQDPPLDLVVVFGGGAQMGPTRPEIGEAGDRLLLAAQLFHQGHAKSLLATGDNADVVTAVIWMQLAVPREKISTAPGKNTIQEIDQLKQILMQRPGMRVGILSSAYHLPRIQRLAGKAGISDLIPIAAHHRTSKSKYSILNFIPSLGPLAKFSDFQREVMGGIVGR